ncbi:MAG: OpgC domain-containing protein [Proteobacteria bacterium]|nr:OpgC domain-containing protein [Pseudomonadota bacterium]
MGGGPVEPTVRSRTRDVRLDFARGLAMFIIFVAHVPDNSWFLFIPARFGFSSAAELFVFCSGLASSYAFGGTFRRSGFVAGSRRVMRRVAQVYAAHIGLVAALSAASFLGFWLLGKNYPNELGLNELFAADGSGIIALLSLRLMPPFTDILPMYIVLLALIPAMMALARISSVLPIVASGGLWLVANASGLNFPANGAGWFFNPLAWQFLFFAGYSFGVSWLKAPELKRGWLFWVCVAGIVISIPPNFWAFRETFPELESIRAAILPENSQSFLSPFRAGHFLILAYVGLVLIEPYRTRLVAVAPIVKVGQQSLPTFLTSTTLIWIAGMVLDWTGRDQISTALTNLAGFGIIIAVAYIAAEIKGRKRQLLSLTSAADQQPLPVAE